MPLNLSTSDGEFTPYLKYNAKAGRFYIRPQGASEDVEVDRPRLAFDMANIKTGWIYYAEGSGPEKIWDPSNTQMAPRPPGPKKFKRGFEVLVFGNDDIPGVGRIGLREFGSTANNVIGPILQMYDVYEREAVQNPGKVPFFACLGVKPVSGAYGTNYEPRFELKGWIEREKIPAFDEHVARDDSNHSTGAYQNGNGAPPAHPVGMEPGGYAAASGGGRRQATPQYPDLNDSIPF